MYTINLISTNHFINYINKSYNTFYLEWKLYMRQVLYLVMLFKFQASYKHVGASGFCRSSVYKLIFLLFFVSSGFQH